MSVDAVLYMPPRVQDLVEVERPRSIIDPVWDRIVYDSSGGIEALTLTTLQSDYGPLEDRIIEVIDARKSYLKDITVIREDQRSFSLRPSNDDNAITVNDYLETMAGVRLLERDLSSDLDNPEVLRVGLEELSSKMGSVGDLHDALEFLINFKINFPAYDVSLFFAGSQEKYRRFIDEAVLRDTGSYEDLKHLAYIKILFPQLLDGLDLVSLPIYQINLEVVKEDLAQGEMYLSQERAVYLKILASETAIIGPTGIELTMPKEGVEVAVSPPLPETRRFS